MTGWRAFYDRSALLGDTLAAVEYQSLSLRARLVAAFSDLGARFGRGTRELDAGCGNGMFWQALATARPAVGVDFSPRMCALARAKGMLGCAADITCLPFADGAFDLIYCAEAIQYIGDADAALAEFARVCAPGGAVLVSTVNRSSALLLLSRLVRRVRPRPSMAPIHARSARELVIAGTAAGLAVGAVRRLGYPLAQLRAGPFAHKLIVAFQK